MNPEKKSNYLKLFTLGSALLPCALRAAHYGFGTDGRGLLIPNHWSVWGISVVSAVFGAVLLLLGSSIPRKGDAPRPASPVSAAGCFALGAVLLAEGLIAGEESQYGLTIITVDGEDAVWETDNAYWAIMVNGEYGTNGVDTTPVNDGDVFQLVYTKM